MTEEEKQARADNCSPEDFAKLTDELIEKAMELYSILTRVPSSIASGFVNYEVRGGHAWSRIEVARQYVNALANASSNRVK